MYIEYNPNPAGRNTGDCTLRAISKAMGFSWDEAFFEIIAQAYMMKELSSISSNVWGSYLKSKGYVRKVIPNYCPDCYTIKDFCDDHFSGTYLVATGSHVVACIDGNYYDSWDSGNEVPVYYWEKNDD